MHVAFRPRIVRGDPTHTRPMANPTYFSFDNQYFIKITYTHHDCHITLPMKYKTI